MYLPFKQYMIELNFNIFSDIKGLRFIEKAISPWYCCFLHTKKHPRGRSIHEIKESFPLKPPLMTQVLRNWFMQIFVRPNKTHEPKTGCKSDSWS